MGQDHLDFAQFYETSWDACLRAVVATVGSPQRAEDLVAEAFARAWISWRKVSRHPAPRAWVVRTALNAGRSSWRRRGREVALAANDAVGRPDAPDGIDASVLAAIRRLPPRQREVIVLRVFLDLDTATTAQVLGVVPGTVMTHLSRAIAALRRELSPADTTEVMK